MKALAVFAAVFAKETLDAARDRRSLGSALIYSLFGPLVLAEQRIDQCGAERSAVARRVERLLDKDG